MSTGSDGSDYLLDEEVCLLFFKSVIFPLSQVYIPNSSGKIKQNTLVLGSEHKSSLRT